MLALLLAALSYALFYLAAPGRQVSKSIKYSASKRAVAAGLAVVSIVLGIRAFGIGLGPTLVITVMMTTGSVMALIGPFVFEKLRSGKGEAWQ